MLKRLLLSRLQYFFFLCGRRIDRTIAAGPSLVVAPHPDDETLGCGAAIVRARAAGQRVRVVIVTDGRASARSAIIAPDALAAMRRSEAKRAARVLGVEPEDLIFLDFPDGETERHMKHIASALREQIEIFAPSQIFACHIVDGHPDHRAVAAAVTHLCEAGSIPCPVYDYPIWFWPQFALGYLLRPRMLARIRAIDARPGLARKREAMAEYRSQLENATGEKGWFILPEAYLARFFRPYELFFERPVRAIQAAIPSAPTAVLARSAAGESLPESAASLQ